MKSSLEQFAIALYEGGYLQGNGDEIETLLNRFKEMEKEQIKNAFTNGFRFSKNSKFSIADEAFYNLTYGGNK
jgi:hypothetical protein